MMINKAQQLRHKTPTHKTRPSKQTTSKLLQIFSYLSKKEARLEIERVKLAKIESFEPRQAF